MAPSPVRATNISLGQRVLQGIRRIIPGTRHRIAPSYTSLTVRDLHRPLPINQLVRLGRQLADEVNFRSNNFVRQGALLRLSSERQTIVVGDLHGNANRLDRILREYGPGIASGEVNLVFLGDAIHPEANENLRDMRSSLEVLNAITRLKQSFPEQIHFLLGNHDEIRPLDPNLAIYKKGVLQTIEFQAYLSDFFTNLGYSSQEVNRNLLAYQAFFDNCPVAAIIEGVNGSTYMAHSAVVKGGVTQEQLIAARQDRNILIQLLYNAHTARMGNPAGKAYTAADVRATIEGLNLQGGLTRTFVLSGHNPNGSEWVYKPFNEVNHFILHSNVNNSFGVLEVINGVPQARQFGLDQLIAARY